MAEPLWTPPDHRVAASDLARFAAGVEHPLDGVALHRWSVDEPEEFWSAAWEHLLPAVPRTGPALSGGAMFDTSWFPEQRLNVAERILAGDADRSRVPGAEDVMLVAVDERGRRRELTRGGAVASAASVAAALRAAGVGPGDRVAAWLPNTLESMVLMLGAASIGAVFSSCSPDFGADGVLDRFGQIEPTVLVAADGYTYGGRDHDRRPELERIVEGLPGVELVVVLPFLREPEQLAPLEPVAGRSAVLWQDWLAPHRDATPHYEQLGFDHPWYVLFSSGTTGVPKCIVHRTGGVLLQHLKEQRLHLDLGPSDRAAYFTTCGWMMWNWLASVPGTGATAVLYEGNPFHPGPERLWQLVEEESLTFLGVSAKYLEAVQNAGTEPAVAADLSTLRTLASTGSPLSPESFEWVMSAVAPGVGDDGLHLASISGGTDLCGCFVGGDPTRPVHAGEIQGPALGMAVDVWSDDGLPLPAGERGELVCTAPFPSMPLGFWGDGPLGQVGPKYRAAYFERIPGVWAQGDFATWTEHGGMVIHGRSDTTLNPGGVRIGTAEIYRQVEGVAEVLESLVFGQQVGNDVRIVLLVRLADGVALDDGLVAAIRTRIREGTTPRHVPALVVAVEDLPRTRSGKLAELAVADVVNGREVRNTTALANPEALAAIAAVLCRQSDP
jgi:acetoacetyl-CoA synthetase